MSTRPTDEQRRQIDDLLEVEVRGAKAGICGREWCEACGGCGREVILSERTVEEARRRPFHCPACQGLDIGETARRLALEGDPSAETVERLGQGWIAEEALAISLYCALVSGSDLRSGLILAVNHSGDCDSIGCITGHLMGAILGEGALPTDLLEQVEGRETIEQLADDLAWIVTDGFDDDAINEEVWNRYPGW